MSLKANSGLSKSGVLEKCGGFRHVWQVRFFELAQGYLKYSDGDDLRGKIPTQCIQKVFILPLPNNQTQDGSKTRFNVVCPNRVYELQAASLDEAEDWVRSIKSWIDVQEPITPDGDTTVVSSTKDALKLNSWRALEKLRLNSLALGLVSTPIRLTGSLTGSVVKFVHHLPEMSARQLGNAVSTLFSSGSSAPPPDELADGYLPPEILEEFRKKMSHNSAQKYTSDIKSFVASYLNNNTEPVANKDSNDIDGESFRAARMRITKSLHDDPHWQWPHTHQLLQLCVESHLADLCYDFAYHRLKVQDEKQYHDFDNLQFLTPELVGVDAAYVTHTRR